MKENQAILVFSALAQESRLRIVRRLVVAGPQGLMASQLAEIVGISRSNLSFHVKELERAGLLLARRQGTAIYYRLDFSVLGALMGFLGENCCSPSAATERLPSA